MLYFIGIIISSNNEKCSLFEEYQKKEYSKSRLRILDISTALVLYEAKFKNESYFKDTHYFTLDSKFYICLMNWDKIVIVDIQQKSKQCIKRISMRGITIDAVNNIYIINSDHTISIYSIDAKLLINLQINYLIFNNYIFKLKIIFAQNALVIASKNEYMISFPNMKIKWQRKSNMYQSKFIQKNYFVNLDSDDIFFQQTRNGRIIRKIKIKNYNQAKIIEGNQSIYIVIELKTNSGDQEVLLEIFDIVKGFKKQLIWNFGKVEIDFMGWKIMDQLLIALDKDKNTLRLFSIE